MSNRGIYNRYGSSKSHHQTYRGTVPEPGEIPLGAIPVEQPYSGQAGHKYQVYVTGNPTQLQENTWAGISVMKTTEIAHECGVERSAHNVDSRYMGPEVESLDSGPRLTPSMTSQTKLAILDV